MKRLVTVVKLIFLLVGLIAFSLSTEPAEALGTICIRADGSVDPSYAPISRSGNVYTLTNNIASSSNGIVIERNDITLDGSNYSLEGPGNYVGILLIGRSNVKIVTMQIKGFAYGIHLYLSSGNNVSWTRITNNDRGIILQDFSNNNSIGENNVTTNAYNGIWLYNSANNKIFSNSVTGSGYEGIMLQNSSDNNNVCGNNVTTNNYEGIYVYESSGNNIYQNTVTATNYDGVSLYNSSYNSIYLNNLTRNWEAGLVLTAFSNNNTIYNNTMASNGGYYGEGILLLNSSYNNLKENTVEDNDDVGIVLDGCSGNRIYHNNFINSTTQHLYIYDSIANIWDDGYPSGGNYWSGYFYADLLSGAYQNETGSDGISDSPFLYDPNNHDDYPLFYMWNPSQVYNVNTDMGYSKIQEAIDAPETLNGHTIYVKTGTYKESIVVYKAISLMGAGKYNTIIDANNSSCAVNVTASSARIASIAIYGTWPTTSCALNIVANNTRIENNVMKYVSGQAIKVEKSLINIIMGNWLDEMIGFGIFLNSSCYNTISRNILKNCSCGISLQSDSDYNNISENLLTDNDINLALQESSNNSIVGNNVTLADYGIFLTRSPNNTITVNTIAKNSFGIFGSSRTSTICHNSFLQNTVQAQLTSGPNFWYGIYPDGGNYWSDYAGVDLQRGPYQNVTGSDGIGDTAYVIDPCFKTTIRL